MTNASPALRSAAPAALGDGALLGVPWALIVIGILIGAVAPREAEAWGAPLLLASGLLMGMPHGAGDWLLLKRAARNRRVLAIETALYLALALGVGALWWWSAAGATWFFLALTAWHWGSGDAHWLHRRGAAWAVFAWGRGLLVMAAPLCFHPRPSALVLGAFASLATGAQFPVEGALQAAPWVLGAALLCCLASGFNRADWGVAIIETGLLLGLFWAAPPLFAITLYFTGVHAWRHILRIERLGGAPLHTPRQIARAVGRFHLQIAPITVLALLGLAPVLALWPQLRADPLAWGAAFLVLISALTLPHAVVVGALDLISRRDAETRRR